MDDESARAEELEAELERVRAERDALREEVEAEGHDRPAGRWTRRGRALLAVVAVVLSAVLVTVAVAGLWARNSFLDTDTFAARAGSLVDDPEVQAALTRWISGEVTQLLDAEDLFEQVFADLIPDDNAVGVDPGTAARVLAVPLAGAVDRFITEQVGTVVSSDQFATLWREAVVAAHTAARAILTGSASDVVQPGQDSVTINLLPVINQVLAQIGEVSPEILGQQVTLPTVTVDDVPDDARQAIGDALGVDVDDDFGTFTVYDDGAVAAAQDALSLARTIGWATLVLIVLLVPFALWVSPHRRRTILQLSIGVALGMVVLRRAAGLLEDDVVGLVRQEDNVGAVRDTLQVFLDPLRSGAGWILVAAVVVAAVALVTGPYPWAVRLRAGVASLGAAAFALAADRSRDEATVAWVRGHREALQAGVAAVGVFLLWWLPLGWIASIVLLALVGAAEVVLWRMAPESDGEPAGAPS